MLFTRFLLSFLDADIWIVPTSVKPVIPDNLPAPLVKLNYDSLIDLDDI